jgi:hypothetical protein
MALASGVNPKFGVAGKPDTEKPGTHADGVYPDAGRGTNVAQTSDAMFSGFLNPEVAQDYFAQVENVSIVQQLAQ